jgi:hypothetical protein
MCLSSVTELYDRPSSLIVDGWKSIGAAKPSFQLSVNGKTAIPFDEWITATTEHAKGGKIRADDGKHYPCGFHCYSDEKELKELQPKSRVFVRGILALGKQNGKAVVIASEIYLPSKQDGWPPLEAAGVPPADPAPGAAAGGGPAQAKNKLTRLLGGKKQ